MGLSEFYLNRKWLGQQPINSISCRIPPPYKVPLGEKLWRGKHILQERPMDRSLPVSEGTLEKRFYFFGLLQGPKSSDLRRRGIPEVVISSYYAPHPLVSPVCCSVSETVADTEILRMEDSSTMDSQRFMHGQPIFWPVSCDRWL